MKILGLPALLLALVGCAGTPNTSAQSLDEAKDYEFRIGTQWTYSVKRGGERTGTLTARVTKVEDGVTHLVFTGKTDSFNEYRWVGEGGIWFSNKLDPTSKGAGGPQMLYKLGTKRGDRWVNFLGDTTAEHQGRTEVQVPAGTYKDAIHIKILSDSDGRVVYESWIVPRLWMVKHVQDPIVIELENFEEPSK